MRIADTWDENVKKAMELFSVCGMQWEYFAPADISFGQIKDNYKKQGAVLGYVNRINSGYLNC